MQDYSAVKDVIAICRDAEQGFHGAANAVKSPLLKELFEQYSVQRGQFASELLEAARSIGMEISNPSGRSWYARRPRLSAHENICSLRESTAVIGERTRTAH
jgi:uncharacterized protein (TIGR02284 family)